MLVADPFPQVKIIDFGLSRFADSMIPSRCIYGNAAWKAPEMFDPEQFGYQLKRRRLECDIYAFAIVCIEVICAPSAYRTI